MWLLTIEDDEGAVSHHTLSNDRCTVGRARDRDLVLTQANISRRHARFERRGEGWQIVDEGSDNGTFVNGCAISRPTPIGINDTLQFGDYRVAISAGKPVHKLPARPPPATPARLRVIAGIELGAEYIFEPSDTFVTIGSARDATVRFVHENVSALHATIRLLPGGRYQLTDRSGTGLIFINGHPLVGDQVLEGGDAINVGGVVLLRFLEASQWPDPRFDMVSSPDAWLPVDLAPIDEPIVVVTDVAPTRPEAESGRSSELPPASSSSRASATPPARATARASETPAARVTARASETPASRPAARVSEPPPPPRSSSRVSEPPPARPSSRLSEPPPAAAAAVRISEPPPDPAARPPAESSPGSDDPQGDDDSKPVSSRRKMLATLRRLASW
jgi:pSer/pThr/pTyr-binding forkhead associated (FHA) protein